MPPVVDDPDVFLGIIWIDDHLVGTGEKLVPLCPGLDEFAVAIYDEHEILVLLAPGWILAVFAWALDPAAHLPEAQKSVPAIPRRPHRRSRMSSRNGSEKA